MCREKTLWEQTVDFHGHECMGLALGYRVAEAALQALGDFRDIDEEMVAIVENDSCAVDAIQFVTGCTLGKGNLIFRDFGKLAYTFILRKNGKAVRITINDRTREEIGSEQEQQTFLDLRKKVFSGQASEEEKELFRAMTKKQTEEFLARPLEEVCDIKEVECAIPEKARIFASVTCSLCGEKVMEPRARVKNGNPVCIPCADSYSRGWEERKS